MNPEKQTILLIEDSEDDVFLMQRALRKAGVNLAMQIVVDGQQALDYLGGCGAYEDRARYPVPSLIFLDLKLPYVHGFEVLQWMRQQPALKNICVIVLTSSPEERDRKRAADLGAKAYFVKPPAPEMIQEAIGFLKECVSSSVEISG